MRCLIATLGKDAPGTNAVVRSATRLALRQGFEVFGAERGFHGIVEGKFHRMTEPDVGSILGRGGSVLGSADYRFPVTDGRAKAKFVASLKKFDLFVAVGGVGSYAHLAEIYGDDQGPTTTMFVPASIENEFLNPVWHDDVPQGGGGFHPSADEAVHAESVGADTAANTAVQAIDRLRDQSFFSRTVFFVECCGLKSNALPIQIGAACGAHRVYLPRYPKITPDALAEVKTLFGQSFNPNHIDVNELVTWIGDMFEDPGRRYLVVVVPSGMPLVNANGLQEKRGHEATYMQTIGSMAPLELTLLKLVDDLAMRFVDSADVQIRYVVIDDLQLGGAPTLRDRQLGSIYGEAAVEEFLAIHNARDLHERGHLFFLGCADTSSIAWKRYRIEQVRRLFSGEDPEVGGVNPIPFFRQMRGTVSGYRPWAELNDSTA